jgi:hypothetical protein
LIFDRDMNITGYEVDDRVLYSNKLEDRASRGNQLSKMSTSLSARESPRAIDPNTAA